MDWRSQATKGISPGARFRFSRTFTAEETEIFGDITRDYNPVHYEPRFAHGKGFSGLICHGLLTASLAGRGPAGCRRAAGRLPRP